MDIRFVGNSEESRNDDPGIRNRYKHFTEVMAQELKTVRETKDRLGKAQTIIVTTDRDPSVENYNEWDSVMVKRTVYVVTKEKVQIDLEGSWQLNYKPTETKPEAAQGLSFEGIPYRIDDLTAGSFDASVTISTDSDITAFGSSADAAGTNNWIRDMLNSDIEITLKNGERLKGLWYCGMIGPDMSKGSEKGASFTMNIAYYKYNDYNNLTAWTNINSSDIKSIKIGGSEILA